VFNDGVVTLARAGGSKLSRYLGVSRAAVTAQRRTQMINNL
jgi:hypothetical protein